MLFQPLLGLAEHPPRLAAALEQDLALVRRRDEYAALPVDDGADQLRREQHRLLVQTALTGRGLDRVSAGRPSWLSRCILHRGEHAAPAASEQP